MKLAPGRGGRAATRAGRADRGGRNAAGGAGGRTSSPAEAPVEGAERRGLLPSGGVCSDAVHRPDPWTRAESEGERLDGRGARHAGGNDSGTQRGAGRPRADGDSCAQRRAERPRPAAARCSFAGSHRCRVAAARSQRRGDEPSTGTQRGLGPRACPQFRTGGNAVAGTQRRPDPSGRAPAAALTGTQRHRGRAVAGSRRLAASDIDRRNAPYRGHFVSRPDVARRGHALARQRRRHPLGPRWHAAPPRTRPRSTSSAPAGPTLARSARREHTSVDPRHSRAPPALARSAADTPSLGRSAATNTDAPELRGNASDTTSEPTLARSAADDAGSSAQPTLARQADTGAQATLAGERSRPGGDARAGTRDHRVQADRRAHRGRARRGAAAARTSAPAARRDAAARATLATKPAPVDHPDLDTPAAPTLARSAAERLADATAARSRAARAVCGR